MEPHEMRRRVDVGPQSLRFEHRPRKGTDGAFSVRARNMDDWGQIALRMSKRGEEARNALQTKINLVRVERGNP